MVKLFPPNDHNQTLRIKRFFIAFASYLMWLGLAALFYVQGITRLTGKAFTVAVVTVIVVNILIYAVFRTGLNKRFKDPSLTLFQMILATIWAMVVVYYTDTARSLVLMLYLVVFVFGLFRLRVRQFMALSLFAVLSYGLVLLLLFVRHPEAVDRRLDLLSIVVLATVLPWFSLVGGYITHLRKQVSAALCTIERLAIIDDLTQVFNRRQMYSILEQQKALGDRGIHPFSICIFDLDHFKTVNDTYGHVAGDIILKTVAQEVHKNLRDIDHIARYGGEEFILILTNSGSREAMICAKRIRVMVREMRFESMPEDFRITISVGVTKYQPTEPIQSAINRADTALYRAKAGGRDRVEYEPLGGLEPV
ncbi:GGDEF domain-containing protein [Desulfatiferula olefinivorans]